MIIPYRHADAAEVAALLDLAPELPSTSEASFRAFAALSFNRDARDFRVLRVGGELVGLMTSTLLPGVEPPTRHFRIVVRPDHRRRGRGAQMMEALQEQDAPAGTILQCNSQRSWTSGNAFLERAEFGIAQTELLMSCAEAPADVGAPDAVTMRDALASDGTAWASLHEHAFGHRPDFSPLTPEDIQTERASPGFTLTVAELRGDVVGYCHGMDLTADEGLINNLVVRRDLRGQGLGAALLSTAMARLRAQGARPISLNVAAENQSAIRLYRRLGFVEYDALLTYRRSARR